MPESLSTPQMLGNVPAHITLSANATDLIRRIFQQQHALQLQQQQQQNAQQQQKQKHTISESKSIRSTSSSPDNGHERNDAGESLDGEDEETRPESVGSSSPQSPPPTAASTSRSSSRGNNNNTSNNPNSIRPQRKLKIYGVEEKLDIIDYAKIIGNRAAGREYNVAESSIREWRKNEAKLRTQAENARSTQNPNVEKEEFYKKLYGALVTYINTEGDGITWKMVRDKCKELWDKWGNGFPEGQVSMHLQGWVARFIQKAREAKDIPEVPPPIPTTNNSSTSNSSLINGITMVPTSSAVDLSPSTATSSSSSTTTSTSVSQQPPAKRSRISNNSNESNISTSKVTRNTSSSTSTSKPSKSTTLSSFVPPSQTTTTTPKSRRKNVAPKRVNDATLKTSTTMPLDLSTRKSTDSKKLSSDVENDEDNAIEVC
jgi:hypothetical protein